MSARRRRVLLVSSSGGHWTELRRLAPAFDACERVWCSVLPEMRAQVAPDAFHLVPDASRWNKLRLLGSALRVALVLLRVRPEQAAEGAFAHVQLVGASAERMASTEALIRSLGQRPLVWLAAIEAAQAERRRFDAGAALRRV